ADLFTMANGFCGIGAIFLAIKFISTEQASYIYCGAGLIPLAIVFDFFDGRVARWRHTSSPMGREMDSLADVISFGVSPAVMAYALGLNTILDAIILIFFAVCGLSRLARYNVAADKLSEGTNKVKYFEGTPITFSIIPLGITLILYVTGHLMPIPAGLFSFHLISLLYIISGCLMISKTIQIPKP
ncbi:MAG: CDP-diacylglycerol--serine O-phosphatidyltransferase, partial [Candidatus Fischerbacteria bacterium RBG_13_37_8]